MAVKNSHVIFDVADLSKVYGHLTDLRLERLKLYLEGRIDGDQYVSLLGSIRRIEEFLDSGLPVDIINQKTLQHEAKR
jgi:hypothetical protein